MEWKGIGNEIKGTENIKLFTVLLGFTYEFKSHVRTLVTHLISNNTEVQLQFIHQTMSWQNLITVLLPALVTEVIKANQSFLLHVDHLGFMMSCFTWRKGTRNRVAKKQKSEDWYTEQWNRKKSSYPTFKLRYRTRILYSLPLKLFSIVNQNKWMKQFYCISR